MLLEQQQSSYNLNINNYSNDNNNDNNKINILEIIDSSRIDEPINSENINNNLNNEEEQEEPMTFNPSKSIKQQMNKEYENEKEIISKSSFSNYNTNECEIIIRGLRDGLYEEYENIKNQYNNIKQIKNLSNKDEALSS